MVLVGITGGSASGKSTLAASLARALGSRGLHLRQDDYYLAVPEGTLAKDHNFDEPAAFDNTLLVRHLGALRAGQPIDRPIYDFTGRGPRGVQRESPRPAIVLEGLFLLAIPEIRDRLDLKIFVHADAEVRYRRRLMRDRAARNWTEAQIYERFWGTVQPGHERWIDPSRAHADHVLINHQADAAGFLQDYQSFLQAAVEDRL